MIDVPCTRLCQVIDPRDQGKHKLDAWWILFVILHQVFFLVFFFLFIFFLFHLDSWLLYTPVSVPISCEQFWQLWH